MSVVSLIADTRKAVADDPANAQALFSAEGTLVGITEVDIRTGAHTFRVDEPPALRVEGDLDIRGFFGFDDTVRPGFTAVRVEVIVTGPESAERYAELAAAVDEHCPVLDLFKNPVPVTRAIAAETVTAAPA